MALPKNPITQPGGPPQPSIADLVGMGAYVRTNRDNQGSWASYLDAIRRVPGSGLGKPTFFETPDDRANKTPRPVSKVGKPVSAPTRSQVQARSTGIPTRSGNRAATLGANPAGQRDFYGAGRNIEAGTAEANYAAGIRRYGAGMRSAPNVGAVRNKGGYNERDRRLAAQREANLATGDALSRVRTMGG